MRLKIKGISHLVLGTKRTGACVSGIIPMGNIECLPKWAVKYINTYGGIKTSIKRRKNGNIEISVKSWASSTCSEQDEFDRKTGAYIAESKAKLKLYRFLRNFAEKMSIYYGNISGIYDDVYINYDNRVDHEEVHINFLGNKNDE